MSTLDAAARGRALKTCLRRWLAASLLLLGGSQAMAQPQCAPGQWLAEYFPNTHLSGAPALQRCEAGPIDHYWTGPGGSPDPARLPVSGANRLAFSAYLIGGAGFTVMFLISGALSVPRRWAVHAPQWFLQNQIATAFGALVILGAAVFFVRYVRGLKASAAEA